MGYISVYPVLNNIPFVKEDVILPEKYHFRNIGEDWYMNLVRDWQFSRPYKVPIQQTDKQYIVFGREDANDMYFKVYDVCGDEIDLTGLGYADSKVFADFVIYDSGAVSIDDDGNETSLTVHMWSFRFEDFELDPGTYYLRMYVEFFDGVTLVETKTWVTEPLDIQEDHPDTTYIECTNSTNRQDVIFNYDTTDAVGFKGDYFFQPVFGYRVQGDIIEYGFQSNDNFFTEQGYQVRNLNPTPYETMLLQVGGRHGIPMYYFQKINHALTMDNIKVEGKRYEKNDGATWAMSDSKTRTLYNGEIELLPYNFQAQSTDNRGALIELLTIPSYPFWIYNAGFNEKPLLVSNGVYITNDTDRDDFITDLNTSYAGFWGLNGTFSRDGSIIYYQNADGENYTERAATILTIYLDVDITTNSNGDNFAFNVINKTQVVSYGGIVWGDGKQQNWYNAGIATSKQLSNTYATAGSYTVRFFPVQTLEIITILRHQHDAEIDDMTGDLPSELKQLTMLCNPADFSSLASGLDLEILANCRQSIAQISISGAGLVGFDGSIFQTYNGRPTTGGNPLNWRFLNGISFYRCAITSSEVEAFIVDFYDHTPRMMPVYMDMRQTPAAPVTNPPATTYKTNLNNAGGTVITD